MWLLAASCYFQMVFIPVYILILVFTIVMDYTAGILIAGAAGRRRRLYLLASIGANVGVLAPMTPEQFWAYQVGTVAGRACLRYRHPKRLYRELIDIVQYCRSRGVRLVFLIFPQHAFRPAIADLIIRQVWLGAEGFGRELGPAVRSVPAAGENSAGRPDPLNAPEPGGNFRRAGWARPDAGCYPEFLGLSTTHEATRCLELLAFCASRIGLPFLSTRHSGR